MTDRTTLLGLSGTAPRDYWRGRPVAEMRFAAEAARLLVDPVFRLEGLPRGDGRTVLLVPGFPGNDYTLALVGQWLRRLGYETATCGFLANAGCSATTTDRITRKVEYLARASGRRIALLGHSRGGILARAVTVRRPQHVSHLVVLGSGQTRQLDVSVAGRVAMGAARAVFARTTEEADRSVCLTERCTCAFARDFGSPLPEGVRATSIYSQEDGVVRWRSCVAPGANNVAITGSHIGLAANRKAYQAIAEALAEPPVDR